MTDTAGAGRDANWDDARQGRSAAVVALADLVEAIDRVTALDLAAESGEDLGAFVIGAHQQLSRLDLRPRHRRLHLDQPHHLAHTPPPLVTTTRVEVP